MDCKWVIVVGGLSACGGSAPSIKHPIASADLAIEDVRVFDGSAVLEHQTVFVTGARIVHIAASSTVTPAGVKTKIDGRGKTLLPGLIDAHTHVNDEDTTREALDFGVTTLLDMYSAPDVSVRLQKATATDRARVFASGWGATAPGGHGTEYGIPVPTLTTPGEARAFVAARVAEGSHHLKLILETAVELGAKIPSLDQPTASALVTAAHDNKMLAVAHVGNTADIRQAINAGIDGLEHLVLDKLDDATIADLAKRKIFVVPTLSVLASLCGGQPAKSLAEDARIAPMLFPDARESLTKTLRAMATTTCGEPATATLALHRAGVRILVGTDAPNTGTAQGASMHDELARLVAAGLTPIEALTGATSAAADSFKLAELGRIKSGAVADLVLVDGDPTTDITATRAITNVWIAGNAVDRAGRQEAATRARDSAPVAPPAGKLALGMLADFDTDNPNLGPISDKIQGGTSTASVDMKPGGSGLKKGRFAAVSGTVVAGKSMPGWAGISILVGGGQPKDLSGARKLTFSVRGPAAKLALFAVHAGDIGFQPFNVTPDWKQVTVDLATLAPLEDIIGFTWASTTPGAFSFELDDVALE